MIRDYLKNLMTHDNLIPILIVVFVASFIISFLIYKPLLTIVIKKKLHDEPNSRSSHSIKTPTIGGVAIYISIVLVLSLFGSIAEVSGLLILTGSLTCLFFTGLNDDLTNLNPSKKAIIQVLVAFLLVVITNIRIFGFSGIFGIYEFPYWLSVFFTVFIYILIINAFNLIDGIDGLAASLAILVCVGLGYMFWCSKEYTLTVLCFSVVGAIIPFLRLNLSKKRKIFMGDSGSMIIGLVVAYCVVNFIYKAQLNNNMFSNNAPVLVGAILFYPLIDTLRIFFIRIVINKTSPFKADRNHIHHKFLNLGYSHKTTTLLIIALNCIVFFIAFYMRFININYQLFMLTIYGVIVFISPFIINKILKKHN